ncbi:MAG: YibE/F family protein [Anaerolineae bacterium]|nr:YibE/F family protein [Anaerolineae bacterium]
MFALLPGVCVAQPQDAESDPPEETILLAAVVAVRERPEPSGLGQASLIQELDLKVALGRRMGEVITMQHEVHEYAGVATLSPGELVYVSESRGPNGGLSYYVVGYARWVRLLWLGLAFGGLVLAVGGRRAPRSLLGLATSFGVIFAFLIPRLAEGRDPLSMALAAAGLALPLSYYVVHGFSRKTTVALIGSAIGLGLTAAIALLFTAWARLTGYASEEAAMLQGSTAARIDVRGLLLAGMVIGVLGVLDDVTVAQAGVVEQLWALDRSLTWRQLYSRAMQVGHDHIASVVNTLALVYAGSALPLLLLLGDQSLSPLYVLSYEVVAEEVVRMLVTSTGLVATVPITTWLAAIAPRRGVPPQTGQANLS